MGLIYYTFRASSIKLRTEPTLAKEIETVKIPPTILLFLFFYESAKNYLVSLTRENVNTSILDNQALRIRTEWKYCIKTDSTTSSSNKQEEKDFVTRLSTSYCKLPYDCFNYLYKKGILSNSIKRRKQMLTSYETFINTGEQWRWNFSCVCIISLNFEIYLLELIPNYL